MYVCYGILTEPLDRSVSVGLHVRMSDRCWALMYVCRYVCMYVCNVCMYGSKSTGIYTYAYIRKLVIPAPLFLPWHECIPSLHTFANNQNLYKLTYIHTYIHMSTTVILKNYAYIQNVCIHTYIHTKSMYTYMHTYIHTYIQNVCIHTCIHTKSMYTYMHTYIHTKSMYTYMHTCIHTKSMYTYIQKVCIHTYMHTYIHKK